MTFYIIPVLFFTQCCLLHNFIFFCSNNGFFINHTLVCKYQPSHLKVIWHWDMVFSECFSFHRLLSFHQYHILTPSSKLFSTGAQTGKACETLPTQHTQDLVPPSNPNPPPPYTRRMPKYSCLEVCCQSINLKMAIRAETCS